MTVPTPGPPPPPAPAPAPQPLAVLQCTINSVDLGSLTCSATVLLEDGSIRQVAWPITLATPGPVINQTTPVVPGGGPPPQPGSPGGQAPGRPSPSGA